MVVNMLSVLVCTYNQEKYLAQALDSILMQKCDEPFEILIGDDCSTDNTGKIADDYQSRYPNKVRVVRPEMNGGASYNIIGLVNCAKGEYLSICDGDDYWLRNDVLQKQLDIFRSMPDVGMICAKAKRYIQEKGDYDGTLGYVGAEDLMTMLSDNQDVAAPTIAFRTALMKKCIAESKWYIDNNWFYDTIMAYWFAYNNRIKFIDEELSAYRILSHSAGHSILPEKEAEYMRRYFAVKWHFILTHPDICSEELFELLMRDYDARTKYIAGVSSQKVRSSKAYRFGNLIINPFRKFINKG
jgi:glycosyltransferase involved in cell wall biosynthesis